MTSRRRRYPSSPMPTFIENGVIEQPVTQIEDAFSGFQRQTREDMASFRKGISTTVSQLSDKLDTQQSRFTERGNVNCSRSLGSS